PSLSARDRPSSPTRRSSDLVGIQQAAALLQVFVDALDPLDPAARGVQRHAQQATVLAGNRQPALWIERHADPRTFVLAGAAQQGDRKSTRLNSSHVKNSYAV